jgi:hypothetical protein
MQQFKRKIKQSILQLMDYLHMTNWIMHLNHLLIRKKNCLKILEKYLYIIMKDLNILYYLLKINT